MENPIVSKLVSPIVKSVTKKVVGLLRREPAKPQSATTFLGTALPKKPKEFSFPKMEDFGFNSTPPTREGIIKEYKAMYPDFDPKKEIDMETVDKIYKQELEAYTLNKAEYDARQLAAKAKADKAQKKFESQMKKQDKAQGTTHPLIKEKPPVVVAKPKTKLGKVKKGIYTAAGIGTAATLGAAGVNAIRSNNQVEPALPTLPTGGGTTTTPGTGSSQSQAAKADQIAKEALDKVAKIYSPGSVGSYPTAPATPSPYTPPTYTQTPSTFTPPAYPTPSSYGTGTGTGANANNDFASQLKSLYQPLQYPTSQTTGPDEVLQRQLDAINAQSLGSADTVKTIYNNLQNRYQSLAAGNETFMSELGPVIANSAATNAALAEASPTVGNQQLAASAGVSDTALGGVGYQGAGALANAGQLGAAQLAADKARGLLNQQTVGRDMSQAELEYSKQLLSDTTTARNNALTLAAQRAQDRATADIAAKQREAEYNATAQQDIGKTLLSRQDAIDYRNWQAQQTAEQNQYAAALDAAQKAYDAQQTNEGRNYTSTTEAAKINYSAQQDALNAAYDAKVKAYEDSQASAKSLAGLQYDYANKQADRIANLTPAQYAAQYGTSAANINRPAWVDQKVVMPTVKGKVQDLSTTVKIKVQDAKGKEVEIPVTGQQVQDIVNYFSDAINSNTGEWTNPATARDKWSVTYANLSKSLGVDSSVLNAILRKFNMPTSASEMTNQLGISQATPGK